MSPSSIEAARAALSHLPMDNSDRAIEAKSRDFYWYSPVLKPRLDKVKADFVVSPRTEAEVIEVLRICHAYGCPVTVRGSGTGNYGQAMPLAGGCVMHMQNMNSVLGITPGRVTVEPGCILRDIDRACIDHSGQELRLLPSTAGTATVGGFVSGGSGGVGSCRWGWLRSPGNLIRLRVVTMEAAPRVLELTGDELARVSHAYGTNGIVTQIELPLAPAYDWIGVLVTFPTFPGAVQFAEDIGNQPGILAKNISVFESPIAHDYFQRVRPHVDSDTNVASIMVAPQSLQALLTEVAHYDGAQVIYRSDTSQWDRDPGILYEYGWNHTTLRALKVDPAITYLQAQYPAEGGVDLAEQMRRAFPGEVLQHLEVIRNGARTEFVGLPLVRFTTEARLQEIIDAHEAAGIMIFNPHCYTLEEGGRQTVDDIQLRFKQEADPQGLLNPGKMISWDRPDWDYSELYQYAGQRT
ncbi:FAD-binding oxidoreductase [Mameliella alba]|nr:FAD-binding oxidoreductase [Mameliella alba]MCA0956454.1 FAD-binding oxidoreductase [Mameliella alba]